MNDKTKTKEAVGVVVKRTVAMDETPVVYIEMKKTIAPGTILRFDMSEGVISRINRNI